MAVNCGVQSVGPVFDVCSAGKEEGTDGLADGANGAFGNAVELVNVSGCEVALDCGFVA